MTFVTEEQIEQLKQYEWGKFCRRYPSLTRRNIFARLFCAFNMGNVQYLLWENGFLQGWIKANEHDEK